MKPQEPPRLKAAPADNYGDASLPVDNLAAQLQRRRAASYRLPPLADGRRDPLDPLPRRS
jgi:hypothetical protein